jgi:tRNA threonylcarbamoyladenosine biosynthesis protein TsaB
LLLAVDTATATASVAVYDTERRRLLAETTWQARRRHTQDLMATVQRALVQAGAAAADLTALAVTTGPGSFTGVRIGISAVKGLGLGMAQPPRAIGLPTLCVTAAPWMGPAVSLSPPVSVCAFIQAGRERYNWAWFETGDLLSRPGREDHAAGTAAEFAAALCERAPRRIWLAGELDADLQQAVAGLDHVCALDAVSALRRAGHLARLAALHLDAGVADDLAALQPLYLRNP